MNTRDAFFIVTIVGFVLTTAKATLRSDLLLMKKILVIKTRREYYIANVAGILCILMLLIWFIPLAITEEGIDFKSVFFWLALLLLILVPYTFIGFFSSIKTVEVTTTGLTISYVFQKHQNKIHFSEIAEVRSSRSETKKTTRSRMVREMFQLVLADGRVFEFDRAQFNQYSQLKAICLRHVRK